MVQALRQGCGGRDVRTLLPRCSSGDWIYRRCCAWADTGMDQMHRCCGMLWGWTGWSFIKKVYFGGEQKGYRVFIPVSWALVIMDTFLDLHLLAEPTRRNNHVLQVYITILTCPDEYIAELEPVISNWLVVWNMAGWFSPLVGMLIQSDELIFFRGVGIPPIR